MIRASLDLGTNTCLLLIVEWDSHRQEILKVLEDHSRVVRLGQGVDRERKFQEEAMRRTLDCLRDYSEILKTKYSFDPGEALAVATSQARDSKNSDWFFGEVKRETGFQFRILSGEQEAFVSFKGSLLPGMNPLQTAVIDIGGGSTEFISGHHGKPEGISLDIGSVRFSERYFKSDPVLDSEYWACEEGLNQELQKALSWRKSLGSEVQFLGVAGTVVTLATWFLRLDRFDSEKLDGCVLRRGDLHRMVGELKWRTVEEKKTLLGLDGGREDVILGGALILWRALEELSFEEVRVSTRGLRFGALYLS